MGRALLIFTLLLFCRAAEAGQSQVFINGDCDKTDSCDLKRFSITAGDYQVAFPNSMTSYGTAMFSEYETDSIGSLENYSIVQFIRGCVFDLYIQTPFIKKEESLKYVGYTKKQFGKSRTFAFSDWAIDSIDKDPAYFSMPKPQYGRFFARRWNSVLGSHDKKTEHYYGEEKPPTPSLYVIDHPGSAFYLENFGIKSAVNISLEFKTCIYKTRNVPLETVEGDVNFAEPIHCFSWRSSFIYNLETRDFESPPEIDPICLRNND